MANIQLNRKPAKKRGLVAGVVLVLLAVISGIIFWLYPFASPVKEDYFSGENPIIFEGKQEGNAWTDNGNVYLPLSLLQEKLDDSIVFDERSQSIILTTKNKVVQMPTDALSYYVNSKPVELQLPAAMNKSGGLYISIEEIRRYYPLAYTVLEDTGAIWIQKDGETVQKAIIRDQDISKERLRLRTEPDLQSPYTADAEANEELYIEETKGEYYFARKSDGRAGYIKKEYVIKGEQTEVSVKVEEYKPELKKIDGPIHLTWEAVYSKNPDHAALPSMPGVNVVSPTWFELAGEDGSVKNLGSGDYVKWAHGRGYQVWGLFSNAFDAELTHQTFKDFETRQKIIRSLLHYSQIYKLDGINLDIENVNEEDGPLVTQFVREATPYFHQAGLTVSMDITFISSSGNWSAFYERDKLAGIVDYLAVMAYDEHWATSPVAGSVASLPWVESNLQALLEVVPKEKLILGVPLYARLWEEKDEGGISSEALSMEQVKEWLTETGAVPVYDEASGQNYAEYYSVKDKATYKIWLEDEMSLRKRAEIADRHGLAGVGSWSRYFADQSAWLALSPGTGQAAKK
ncbi:glycosyl hydrolase family 18 protein [Bacillus infantis]|uniref:glycosyl hydrolase family 18 protein n=1 Tax=Bacillus infantis TaxID=324767 RepID=UPI00344DD02A